MNVPDKLIDHGTVTYIDTFRPNNNTNAMRCEASVALNYDQPVDTATRVTRQTHKQ